MDNEEKQRGTSDGERKGRGKEESRVEKGISKGNIIVVLYKASRWLRGKKKKKTVKKREYEGRYIEVDIALV